MTLALFLLIFGFVIFACIRSVSLARQNRLVFFNTKADLHACFGILAVPLLLIFILGPFAVIAGIPIALIYNIVKPIWLNCHKVYWYDIGFLILARIVLGIILPLFLIWQFLESFGRKKDEDGIGHLIRAAFKMTIVSGALFLMHKLVNGDKVNPSQLEFEINNKRLTGYNS